MNVSNINSSNANLFSYSGINVLGSVNVGFVSLGYPRYAWRVTGNLARSLVTSFWPSA